MKPEPVVSSPAAIHLALLINMLSMGSMMMVMPLGPGSGDQPRHGPGADRLLQRRRHPGSRPAWVSSPPPGSIRVNRKPALLVLLTLRFLLLDGLRPGARTASTLLLLFILSGCVAGPLPPS